MPQAWSTKKFIKESRKVHGGRYNYLKVDYKNAKTKVTIICPNHGKFIQRPDHHLNGHGCLDCGYEEASNKQTNTTAEFITKANKIHNNTYDYSKVKYKDYETPITIICPTHGAFKQKPHVHLNGSGCSKCGNIKISEKLMKSLEEFIKESKELHGNKYNYSKVIYKGYGSKVNIICPYHGIFKQSPSVHLEGKGCAACSNNKKLTNSVFIKRAKSIHGDKYDYSQVKYVNIKEKVSIICPIHGLFSQTPNDHLAGCGCMECGIDSRTEYMRKNPPGWSYSNWEKLSKKSKRFDSYKVYVVKIKDFYKIGRTFTTIKGRFNYTPVDPQLIYKIESEDARYICELEQELQNKCREYHHIPHLEFEGMYECFSSIEPIKDQLEQLT